MSSSDILPPETSVSDRLLTTAFLTALLHLIVVLGVTFQVAAPPDAGRVPSLDIMLVSDEIPESRTNDEAQYLSQRTQQGAGNMSKPDMSRTPTPGDAPAELAGESEGTAARRTPAGPAGGESAVLTADTQRGDLVFMADAMETGATLRSRESVVGTTTPLPSARTDHDLRLKGPRARELLVTPSTRASTVAVYLDSWRRKVERIGTLHFPNEARRQHMSGSPVLEVVLRSDGRLAEVWIRRSSGHAELDQAAIGVLKMASPFDPFPASLAAGHDTLRFAYEWQFIGGASAGSLVSSMPDTD
ncbi:MAG: TonB family protein [Steroidobacteraceae bacterium]